MFKNSKSCRSYGDFRYKSMIAHVQYQKCYLKLHDSLSGFANGITFAITMNLVGEWISKMVFFPKKQATCARINLNILNSYDRIGGQFPDWIWNNQRNLRKNYGFFVWRKKLHHFLCLKQNFISLNRNSE